MKTTKRNLKGIFLFILFLVSNHLLSQTNTSPTQTVCAGSLAEPYLINPPTTGSTYQWSISGGGTINLGPTTDNITVDWGVTPGTYTITVIETDINNCQGVPVTVDVTVNPLPTATVATSQAVCFGSSVPDLTAIGANVTWYSDPGLTTIVSTGNNFTTGQTAIGLYTYYVTESLNGCEGPSIAVTLEIYALPSSPTATSQTVCFGSSVPDLIATGTNLTWYSDPALTAIVGNGSTFSTGQTSSGTYTYYVTNTDVNGCESNSTTVTLEIYALPLGPASSNEVACTGNSIPDLTATGTNLTWYSDAALTTIVGTGNTFSTGHTAVGVYTYYVTETDANGCEGDTTMVTLTINSFTNVPVASNQSACFGSTIPDLTASGIGSSFTWYSDPALTAVVNTGSLFATGQTAVGIYTYYVTESQNNCESPSSTVILEIYALPTTGPINHW
ncbi:MAG: hypothetical protein VX370_00740 [Bacteroidota bacterium]|nr:hypothetical protein [Bacteroidota bacterium]